MIKKKGENNELILLRQKAEDKLKDISENFKLSLSEPEVLKLYHELKVYSEELKFQNEELKCTREKLEEALDKYVMLYDFSHAGYFTLDADGTILEVNLTGANLLGKDRHNLLKLKVNFRFFVSENTRAAFNNFLRNVFEKDKKAKCNIELITDSNPGLYIYIEGTKAINKNYCLITVKDFSELKHSENAFRKTLDDLMASNTELEKFVNVISEDLQEPLAKVIGYTQMLEHKYKDKLGSEGSEFINAAVKGARLMQTITRGIVNYSRAGRYVTPLLKVDCSQLIEGILFNLHYTIEDNYAIINYSKLPSVYGDTAQLILLFQNLIDNAIKFHCNERPVVNISYIEDNERWIFIIEDNGIGIAPKFHDKIFSPFQHLNINDEFKGTGVGLAIAKKIIDKHNGKIWLKSDVGKGASFYFSLPKPENLIKST